MTNAQVDNWFGQNRKGLLIGGPLFLLLIGMAVYLMTGRYVSTDNAYVQVARTDISADVSGRVIEVLVKDNQSVHKDDVLFKIDQRDLVIAVNSAEAKRDAAKLQIAALKATYLQYQADLHAAQNQLMYAEREYRRQKKLVAQGLSSQAQLDQAENLFLTSQGRCESIVQERENILASLADNPDINENDHPAVKQAQAALEQAMLNLSRTVVKAPVDGVLAKVDGLQVGDYIQAGSPLFSLISENIWIEANFRETELAHIRPGQKATIKVDTYPGVTFHGTVLSLSPGTGASFSLLPPENATGNWVKVVQRMPLRISVIDKDPKMPLFMGLSAVVEVDIRSEVTSGHA